MNSSNTIRFEEGGLRPSDVTPEDVRRMLGLPIVEERKVVFGQSGDWNQSNRHKALVNVQTGQLYGILSDQYRVVRHEEGLLDIMTQVDANPEFGPIEWSVRGSDDFRKAHLTGRFVERPQEIAKGDLVDPTIEYYNSYDGTWGERFLFGAFRLVCSNGMVVGVKISKIQAMHLGKIRPESVLLALGEAMEAFSMQVDLWRGWVDRQLSIAHVEDAIDLLDFNEKEKTSVLNEVDESEEMNLWMFYNVITALATHRMGSLDRQVRTWNRLRSVQRRWDA